MARRVILKVSGFETRCNISSVTRQPAHNTAVLPYHTASQIFILLYKAQSHGVFVYHTRPRLKPIRQDPHRGSLPKMAQPHWAHRRTIIIHNLCTFGWYTATESGMLTHHRNRRSFTGSTTEQASRKSRTGEPLAAEYTLIDDNPHLMEIFPDNLGKLIPECLHSGFYCTNDEGRGGDNWSYKQGGHKFGWKNSRTFQGHSSMFSRPISATFYCNAGILKVIA